MKQASKQNPGRSRRARRVRGLDGQRSRAEVRRPRGIFCPHFMSRGARSAVYTTYSFKECHRHSMYCPKVSYMTSPGHGRAQLGIVFFAPSATQSEFQKPATEDTRPPTDASANRRRERTQRKTAAQQRQRVATTYEANATVSERFLRCGDTWRRSRHPYRGFEAHFCGIPPGANIDIAVPHYVPTEPGSGLPLREPLEGHSRAELRRRDLRHEHLAIGVTPPS